MSLTVALSSFPVFTAKIKPSILLLPTTQTVSSNRLHIAIFLSIYMLSLVVTLLAFNEIGN